MIKPSSNPNPVLYVMAVFLGFFFWQFRDTPRKVNLVLDNANRNLAIIGVTMGQLQKSSHAEERYFAQELPTLTGKVENSIDSLNAATVALQHALDATSKSEGRITAQALTTMQSLQPVIQHSDLTIQHADNAIQAIPPVAQSAEKSITDFDSLVADPHVRETVAHVDQASANIAAGSASAADTVKHLDSTAGNIDQKVNSWVHPTWPKRVWSATTSTIGAVLKWLL